MGTPRAVRFVGSVFFALLDTNRARVGGYVKAGNFYPLSLKVETDQKTMISAMRENAGQTLWADTRITGITGSGTLREIMAATFAWLLSGTATAMIGTGGTVTDEPVTIILDEWVPLDNKGISSVVSGAYALGTDFEFNAALGLFMALSSGSMSAGADVVSYVYAAEVGNQIKVGDEELIRVAMLIDGENKVTGEPIVGEFDSVILGTASEINMISDPTQDYDEFGFNLIFETLSGKTSPGTLSGVLD